MPRGVPLTTPLPKCRRTICPNQVKTRRSQWCSIACHGLDSRGVEKAPPPSGKYRGQFSQITIAPEKHSTYQPPAESVWTTKDREGFTAAMLKHKFNPARNAQPTHSWTDFS